MALATKEPRTKAGIAASSGNSCGKSQPPNVGPISGAIAVSADAMSSRAARGLPLCHSEMRPPAYAPSARDSKITPMTLVQTYAESPNDGANKRTAVSSMVIQANPERNATTIAVRTVGPRNTAALLVCATCNRTGFGLRHLGGVIDWENVVAIESLADESNRAIEIAR